MTDHASPRRSVPPGSPSGSPSGASSPGAPPPWRRLFERIDRGYGRLVNALAVAGALAACVIMAAMSADVAFRNLFNRSLAGTFEIVEVAMVLAVFMGLASAERNGTTVRVTLFTSLMPRPMAEAARIFGLLVSLAIVAWFAQASIDRALHAYAIGEYRRGIISFPLWPGRSIVALGFTMLAIELALGVLRRLVALTAPPPSAPASAPRSGPGAAGSANGSADTSADAPPGTPRTPTPTPSEPDR